MTTKFGWCLDSMHDKCVVWFRWESGTTECDCACHEGKEKPALKEAFVEAPRKPSRAGASSVQRASRGNEKSATTSPQSKAAPKRRGPAKTKPTSKPKS